MRYVTTWQPNRNAKFKRSELLIRTASGALVAIVAHARDVAAAIAAYESNH